MNFRPQILERDRLDEASQFLATHPAAMLYHQPSWLRLVGELTDAEVRYVSIVSDGHVVAVVPVALKDGTLGRVANSCPFFGSHGGILATGPEAFEHAARAFLAMLKDEKVVLANVIEPLFGKDSDVYRRTLPVADEDIRTGQFKDLGPLGEREALLGSVSGLVRSNLRRRAWKSGLRVERDESASGLAELCAMHQAEMGAKAGGNPKPKRFFDLVARHLVPGSGWRLYFGSLDGVRVAGLLVLLWRDYTEYYTPVFRSEYRQHQPASAVIFDAMLDAAREGRRWWNFGGSWPTQPGVKTFKDSWGATNREYRYYILDFGGLATMRQADRGALLREYDGFYLYPFR